MSYNGGGRGALNLQDQKMADQIALLENAGPAKMTDLEHDVCLESIRLEFLIKYRANVDSSSVVDASVGMW